MDEGLSLSWQMVPLLAGLAKKEESLSLSSDSSLRISRDFVSDCLSE